MRVLARRISQLPLELQHQSKPLILQFYKYANPRLGIMAPHGLIILKIYYITWNYIT